MSHIKRKSFTLIEMLIVIVIIGILAAALVPRLQAVQGRARDAKRKADLSQINTAIAIFHSDNGRYLVLKASNTYCAGTDTVSNSIGTCGGQWITLDTGFYNIITSVPVDPTNVGTANAAWITGNNMYTYHTDGGVNKNYFLVTQLENGNDPERCSVKPIYRWNGGAAMCPPRSGHLAGGRSANIYGFTNYVP